MLVKLNCLNCDNFDCKESNRYIAETSLEGCSREVSEDVFNLYYHYMFEVCPFVLKYKNPEKTYKTLDTIYDFLNDNIFSAKFVNKFDEKGKLVPNTQLRSQSPPRKE